MVSNLIRLSDLSFILSLLILRKFNLVAQPSRLRKKYCRSPDLIVEEFQSCSCSANFSSRYIEKAAECLIYRLIYQLLPVQ